MEKIIDTIFSSTGVLTVEQILINLGMAVVIGMIIYLSYKYTHAGTIYSDKFNISLVMLTLVTTIVMTVIQNNIALSLGTIGALSIVRFRTAIKDPRDTVHIFWAIATGVSCGTSSYTIAVLGAVILFFFLLFFGKVKNSDRLLLIIRGDRTLENEIEAIIFDYFKSAINLRVKNTSKENIEYIYEIAKKTYDSVEEDQSIIENLYKLKKIDYVNVVCQNDEING